jgi:hypothetical protein
MNEPLSLVTNYLAERGAVVEPAGDEVEVLAPEELAAELGLPGEHSVLAAEERDGAVVHVGFGTPLLERVTDRVCQDFVIATVRPDFDLRLPPTRERALREVEILNGVPKVFDEADMWGWSWLVTFRYVVDMDERLEGMLTVGVTEQGAALPGLLDAWGDDTNCRDEPDRMATQAALAAAPLMTARATRAAVEHLEARLGPGIGRARRRLGKERARIERYFTDLIADQERAMQRRNLSARTLEVRREKIMATRAEQSAKLAALNEKYALRLEIRPVAALAIRAPARACTLRVKRRKQEVDIKLRFNGLARAFEPLICQACGASTHAVGVCDARHHLLCKACLDKSGGAGRRDCPACGGERPGSVEGLIRKRLGGLLGRPPDADERARPGATTPTKGPRPSPSISKPERAPRPAPVKAAERGKGGAVPRTSPERPESPIGRGEEEHVQAAMAELGKAFKRFTKHMGEQERAEAKARPARAKDAGERMSPKQSSPAQIDLDFSAPATGATSSEASRILAYLSGAPEGSRMIDLSEALQDLTKGQIARALKELVDAGQIRKSGRTRGTRYHRV